MSPTPRAAVPSLRSITGFGRALGARGARGARGGEAPAAELGALRAALQERVALITARMPAAVARYEERLRERIRGLLAGAAMDEGRVLTEVAIWAEKTDVQEELARLQIGRAHV